jgi:hypothetical protein
MKKFSFLLVAILIIGLVSINSCKSTTKPAQPAESAVQEKVDTLKSAVDTASSADADTSDVIEE